MDHLHFMKSKGDIKAERMREFHCGRTIKIYSVVDLLEQLDDEQVQTLMRMLTLSQKRFFTGYYRYPYNSIGLLQGPFESVKAKSSES